MKVFHWHQLFKKEILEQNASHFEVIYGDGSVGDSIHNGLGPFDTPDEWVEVVDAGEPDATRAVLAGITVAQVGRLAWDKLLAMNWVVTKQFEECVEVCQGIGLGRLWVNVDGSLVGFGCSS